MDSNNLLHMEIEEDMEVKTIKPFSDDINKEMLRLFLEYLSIKVAKRIYNRELTKLGFKRWV